VATSAWLGGGMGDAWRCGVLGGGSSLAGERACAERLQLILAACLAAIIASITG